MLFVSGSQDLNRPAPPAYAKFSSLDRRALARRHHTSNASHLQQQQHANSNNNPVHLQQQQVNYHNSSLQQQLQQQGLSAAKSSNNPLKLSTFNPTEMSTAAVLAPSAATPQKVAGAKCQPERRHSSYNPASSLTRTPSQNSEYR